MAGSLSTSTVIKAPRTRALGNVAPEIVFEGDWSRVIRTLDDVPNILRAGALAGQESAAKKLITIVKQHIMSNGGELGWPSLKTSTQTKKAKQGFPADAMYRMTFTYFNAIKKWRKGNNVYVGIQRGIRHPISKGLTIGQIANVLEYGSQARGIPARPLWIPSFRKFGGTKKIRKLILWHIAAQFRMRHGISPKMTI